MFSSLEQPYIGLIFLSGGLLSYLVYELLYMFKELTHSKLMQFVCDFLSVCFIGAAFLFLAEKFYFGQLKFYCFFCFLSGLAIMRLVLKTL